MSGTQRLRAENYELTSEGSHLNHHIPALHRQWIHRNLRSSVVRGFTGLRIPSPPMPGTNQLVAFNHALPQRPPAVQTNVVHGRDRPVHVSHADNFVSQREFPSFAFRRKLSLSRKLYEVGHWVTGQRES